MTLQQFEYILALDRFRHFARAAEHCHVTQPTLSTMIQKLEDELGVKLFDRTCQPIVPTAIGAKILKQARIVLTAARRMSDIIEEEKTTLTGVFRLAVLPTIAPYLLPRFLPAFSVHHPSLELHVSELKTREAKQALLNGEVDAALIAEKPSEEWLSGETVCYDQFYGYVSRNESLSENQVLRTSDLTDRKLWLLDEGHCFRDQLLRICQMEGARFSQTAYRLGSMETFMRMVESGEGITFVPELAVLQLTEEQKQLVRPFAIPSPTRRIFLAHPVDCIRRNVIDTLVREMRNSLPATMLHLQPTQYVV
ncbi:MAG: hydrogen peroxide-inducible genes activator [Bacteroides sp.]|nr:hydrogen peroxide-inducible genes activator [Bacteroides sp.]